MGKLKDQGIRVSELGASTFRHDGYRDAFAGLPQSPPPHFVFEAEYNEGYAIGLADLQRMEQTKGSD